MSDTQQPAKGGFRSREWARDLPPPIVMMGVPFDQLTKQQAMEIAAEMVESGEPHLLATANVDFLAQVQEDDQLQRILVDADLILCDGTPLLWMSRLLGDPLPERVAGSDMVPVLLDMAERRGFSVFLLGGKEDVAELARENIRKRWPDLKLAGSWSPPFAPLDKMDHEDICRRVRESGADMLFVSFGCPKQEKWLQMNYRDTGACLCMGVGATIDFLAGTVRRAPVWMRTCGLEWVFRTMQEPRRLAGRYWNDIRVVVPGLLRQIWHMRSDRQAEPPLVRALGQTTESVVADEQVAAGDEPEPVTYVVVELPERLDMMAARDESLWPKELAPSVILDARATKFMDSTGTGKLVRFARNSRERGGSCILAGAQPAVLMSLDLMKLRGLFVEVDSIAEAVQRVGA